MLHSIFGAVSLVCCFALFQFTQILDYPIDGINPRLWLVPIMVGVITGAMVGRIRILQRQRDHHMRALQQAQHGLLGLNQLLEARVRERTERLSEAQRFTQQVLDAQPHVVLLSNMDQLVQVNQAFFRLLPQFGSLEAFLARHHCICELFEQGQDGQFISNKINGQLWVSYIDEHPEETFLALIGGIVFDMRARHLDVGDDRYYVVNMVDITESMDKSHRLEEASSDLLRELHLDRLTGLPNRTHLLEELEATEHAALILLDIDSFKEINDFFGHDSGDDILVGVSERLQPEVCALDGQLFRLSADEFGILLDVRGEAELIESAHLLLDVIEQDPFFDRNGAAIGVSATMGAVMRHQLGEHLPLAAAAVALKSAKHQHRPFLMHSEAMEQHDIYARNIAQAEVVRQALRNRRVFPFYQPILDLKRGTVEKFEVLARIRDEEDRLVLPGDFLHAAKATKFYPQLTRMILDQALARLAQMDARVQFSVNLSIEDILDHDTADYILARIEQSGLGGRCILEILESEGLRNITEVHAFIRRARDLGCRLAIDDFGAGFSNFEYLLQLEVDFLKLDASLVRDLGQDGNARIIVNTIQEFARQLGIRTVAEHVHNAEVLAVVQELGIDYAQGFHIARPQERPEYLGGLPSQREV